MFAEKEKTALKINTLEGKQSRDDEKFGDYDKRIQKLEEEEESAKIRPPIDGNEVMDFLQIGPGPIVGEALNHLLEAKLEGSISTKEEAYVLLKSWTREKGIGNRE